MIELFTNLQLLEVGVTELDTNLQLITSKVTNLIEFVAVC